MEKNLDCT